MTYKTIVTLSVLGDGDRAVAEATLADRRYLLTGLGSSGREPGDKACAEIGADLAVARALRSLAAKLERQAHGSVKHREDMRRHRRLVRAARPAVLREKKGGAR